MVSSINFVPDKGWRRFERAVSGTAFHRAMNKHLSLATRRNGFLAVRAIRQSIKNGNFEANAALTVGIKGSSKPLVDKGGLFQSATSQMQGGRSVFAGILQTDELYNIAVTLHDGASVTVTPKMRNMFKALWWASIGTIDSSELRGAAAELWERKPGDWLPLRENTIAIVIPGRPFIEEAFSNRALIDKAIENWQRALASAFKELARR